MNLNTYMHRLIHRRPSRLRRLVARAAWELLALLSLLAGTGALVRNLLRGGKR